eukprot:5556595-Alexandrium_andersonii.AAC.1
MSASLVGSEMCIRDRHDSVDGPAVLGASPPRCVGNGDRARHFACCARHGASTSSVIWCASLAA